MAIKFEKLEEGMTLLDVKRTKMGNTTMSQWSEWEVKIVSIDREKRTAVVSWNGNPPTTWNERSLKKLHRTSPKCMRDQRERRRAGSWF